MNYWGIISILSDEDAEATAKEHQLLRGEKVRRVVKKYTKINAAIANMVTEFVALPNPRPLKLVLKTLDSLSTVLLEFKK